MSKADLEEDLRATFERAAASVPFVPDLASRVSSGARQRQRRTWAAAAAAAACVAIIGTAGILWQTGGPGTGTEPATGPRTEAVPTAAGPTEPTQPIEPTASMLARLVGTWRPVSIDGFTGLQTVRPDQPLLTFKADGTWSGSDGCNALAGTFTVTEQGRFASTAKGQRMAGCTNVPHSGLLAAATQVSVSGSTLRLVDADGRQVASYARTR